METNQVSLFTAARSVGWGEILKRTGRAIYEDDCFGWAAELAYYWFLALFPALLFLVALASHVPSHGLFDAVLGTLGRFTPDDVIAIVRKQLAPATGEPHRGLLAFSILGSLWSSSAGMMAVISTLNQTYRVQDRRPWWRVHALAVALSVALAAFSLTSLGLLMAGPTLAERVATSLHLGRAFTGTWTIVQWPVIFGLLATALGSIYHFAPDVDLPRVWLTPGSIVATLGWMAASLALKGYADHFGAYQIYGAIGGVIVALLWFYVSGLAILIGAELNASIAHASPLHRQRDSERPLPNRLRPSTN